VHGYFTRLTTDNDITLTAHSAIARFLTAAHETMLKWLKEEQQRSNSDGKRLRDWWHTIMEQSAGREKRRMFFTEVLERAKNVSHQFLMFQSSNRYQQIKIEPESPGTSPNRSNDKNDRDIVAESRTLYDGARVAVEALMTFLASLCPGEQPLCVTYFDEAHELHTLLWILLRLLSHQPMKVMMWYVFMGTKPSISYFNPAAPVCVSSNFAHVLISHCRIIVVSLRLNKELRKLLPPYIALGFDQNTSKGQPEATATIGELQSLEHLASYGRPMYAVLFSAKDVAYYILGGRRSYLKIKTAKWSG
jgi:hypothetical protein